MSLLNDASLIVTPNAYKEGKLYSVIPSDGSGDMSVTRATTATRVNSQGLVELVPYNLATWSEQFDNAAWTKINATITANSTTAPNGATTADLITSTLSSFSAILQGTSQTSGNTYTLSCYAKKGSSDWIFLRLTFGDAGTRVWFNVNTGTIGTIQSGLTATIESVGNGWYRCSVTGVASATPPANRIDIALANADASNAANVGNSVYAWGAQLVEGTEAKDYYPTETRLNIPRLDYSLGGCPSILVEPQRTNLFTYSEQFDNAAWTKVNSTITANAETAPNGTLTADLYTALTDSDRIQSTVSYASATYTFSIWVKNTGSNVDGIITFGGIGTVNFTATNEWQRITATATTSIAASLRLLNAGETVYIWGAQLEAGAYATSYIPTTSASVTRNYDIPSLTNIYTSGKLSASGGTWFTHFVNNVPRTRDSGGGVGLRLSNVAANNLFHISTPSGSNQRYWIRKIVGGANTDLYNTLTDEIKVAIKWNGSTADVFVNGVKVVSATAFTSVDLENLNVNNGNIPYYISSMWLEPTPLSDAELIQATTI